MDLKGGEWPRGIDVVAAGEKIRVGWRVPEDDPPTLYYWVYDGDRLLEHISDGEIPNTVYESPQQDSEMYPITQGWVLPLGGEALDSACPGGRPFGTKTIAGRTASRIPVYLQEATHPVLLQGALDRPNERAGASARQGTSGRQGDGGSAHRDRHILCRAAEEREGEGRPTEVIRRHGSQRRARLATAISPAHES